MIKHEAVIELKYIAKHNLLVSIGSEGKICSMIMDDFQSEAATYKAFWNPVCKALWVTEDEVLIGTESGAVQYIRFSWKK